MPKSPRKASRKRDASTDSPSWVALTQTPAELQAVYDGLNDAVLIVDIETRRIVFNNPMAVRLFGYSDKEFRSLAMPDLYSRDGLETADREFEAVKRKGSGDAHGIRFRRKNGSVFVADVSARGITFNDRPCLIGFLRDATERRRVEEILRQSRDFNRSLLEDFPALVWMAGTDSHHGYFNRTWLSFRGRTMDQEVGDGWIEGVHPEDRARYTEAYRKAFQAREPFEVEHRLRRYDGEYRWMVNVGRPFNNIEGHFGGFIGSCYDITDRKQAEKALARAKDEWERTFDAVPDLIAILDNEHRMVGVNKAMALKMGIRLQDVVGLRCYAHVHGTDRPPDFCPHSRLLADGREHTQEVHEERLGGDFLVTVSPLRDERGQLIGCVHVARDITEHKRAEKMLQDHAALQVQQKLARDLHDSTIQSLYAVGLGLESCRQLLGKDLEESRRRLIRCIEELSSAMRDIRTHVSRLRSDKLEEEGFPALLESVISRVMASHPIQVQREIDASVFTCLDGRQEDHLLNIVRESMSNSIRHGKATRIVLRLAREGSWVRLEIEDNGAGFEEAIGAHPGMGLKNIQSRCDSMAAKLDLRSQPGHGTCLRLDIPIRKSENA